MVLLKATDTAIIFVEIFSKCFYLDESVGALLSFLLIPDIFVTPKMVDTVKTHLEFFEAFGIDYIVFVILWTVRLKFCKLWLMFFSMYLQKSCF